jgi:hypothetical protein
MAAAAAAPSDRVTSRVTRQGVALLDRGHICYIENTSLSLSRTHTHTHTLHNLLRSRKKLLSVADCDVERRSTVS